MNAYINIYTAKNASNMRNSPARHRGGPVSRRAYSQPWPLILCPTDDLDRHAFVHPWPQCRLPLALQPTYKAASYDTLVEPTAKAAGLPEEGLANELQRN